MQGCCTGLGGSSPGVLLVVAGAWLLPLPDPLRFLRKMEVRGACRAEEEEGAHERSSLALTDPEFWESSPTPAPRRLLPTVQESWSLDSMSPGTSHLR